MSKYDPQSTLTPEQRRTEVAAILSRGLLRAVRARRAAELIVASPDGDSGLEVSGDLRLSVVRDDDAPPHA